MGKHGTQMAAKDALTKNNKTLSNKDLYYYSNITTAGPLVSQSLNNRAGRRFLKKTKQGVKNV